METSVRINKFELEAFLSELLQFARQYEKVLKQLDLAEANIQTIGEQIRQQINDQIRQRITKSSHALKQIRDAIMSMCVQTEEMLEGTVNE